MVKVCKFLKWFVALLIIVLGSFISVGNVVNAGVGEQIQVQKIKSLDKIDVNLKNWDDYSDEYKMSLVKNTATGHAVFCIQPEKEYPSSGSYLTVKSRLENKTIANLILNFQNQKEYLSHLNEDAQYAATQCAIFYVVSGNKDDLNVDPVVKKLVNYANGLPDPIEKMNHFSLNITPNNQTMTKKGDGYSTTYSIETQASDLSDVQIDIKSNNKEAQEKVNYSVKGKELEINVPNEVVNHSQTQIHFDIKLTAKLVSTLQLSGYLVPAQSSRQDMATMQAFQVKSSKLYATDTKAIIETPTKPAEPTALKTPEIKTNAINAKENTKVIPAIEKAQVKDVVDYKNLLPGKEYELHGKLMDKATGKALLIDGKEVTASKTFTALEATGQEALVFDFNASALTGKKLVVFEELTQAGQLVATHSDLNDANQTVEVPTKPVVPTVLKTPEIKTNAINAKENTKMIPAIEKAQVKDVVDYKNLLPGKEYELHGKLMDKATGKALLIDGKEVTASKTNQLLPATGEVKSILLVIVGFLLLVLSVLVLRYLSKNR
ncbi:VaFE repeat-containing surface-anchored protein [Enterococcus villorum]|uniref:VaFE repeat-containing surface-anchored protein n=1 Tax=Enterococcus villorum TaxID=112904 RepID=UPI003F886730